MDVQKIRNMEEFSEVSGISRPTISKYFNDPATVKPRTRERIEHALNRYDFRPNLYAINQNRKFTKNIGVVVPHLIDPFFAEIVRQIEMRCLAEGYWAIVLSSHGQAEMEVNALDMLRSLKLAGTIIAPLGEKSDRMRIRQISKDMPTVIFDSHLEIDEVFFGTDNYQSIGLIVDYLCRSGEPPCFMQMPGVNTNAVERSDAYVKSMERFGLEPKIVPVAEETWNFEHIGYSQGLRLLAERKFPSSTVLCANDRLAIGLMAAAYEMGLQVGRGPGNAMRIAGHDDHPFSRFTSPPLTTVAQDYTLIAEKSVSTLFEMIDNGRDAALPRTERLEARLIMRASA